MPLILNGVSLLLGRELDYVERGHLVVDDGKIISAGEGSFAGKGKSMDGRGFLVMPGFINAHTHIADSVGKDIASGQGLDARVHPAFSAKKKILELTGQEHLKNFIRISAISMMKKGIVAFADFREGGPQGIRLLKEAIAGLPIKCVALGRTGHVGTLENKSGLSAESASEAAKVLEIANGLGISGANEHSDSALLHYRELAKGALVAIHAAESAETVSFSRERTGKSEVERIMANLKPDFLVHMTNATDDDIALAATSRTGIVVCPRANGVLGAGIPKVAKMLKAGCTVAVGTDNVMLNSPDISRELDYIWKASRATEGEMIAPREILKMATSNAAEILRLNSGWIEPGRAADLLFVDKHHADLYPMHDPHAALVHRLGEKGIASVMIDGRFVGPTN